MENPGGKASLEEVCHQQVSLKGQFALASSSFLFLTSWLSEGLNTFVPCPFNFYKLTSGALPGHELWEDRGCVLPTSMSLALGIHPVIKGDREVGGDSSTRQDIHLKRTK